MYDHFNMDQIKEWGSPALIEKAEQILRDVLRDKFEGN
jgi:hypothetical protein